MKNGASILGLLMLGLVAWGVKATMPDIIRYLRMKNM